MVGSFSYPACTCMYKLKSSCKCACVATCKFCPGGPSGLPPTGGHLQVHCEGETAIRETSCQEGRPLGDVQGCLGILVNFVEYFSSLVGFVQYNEFKCRIIEEKIATPTTTVYR